MAYRMINDPPAAAFTESCTDLGCDFTDQSTDDGMVTGWSWGFGDGSTSTAQNPSHTYAAGGTYTVTLTVTDDRGDSNTTSHSVTVNNPVNDALPSVSITAPAGGSTVSGTVTIHRMTGSRLSRSASPASRA